MSKPRLLDLSDGSQTLVDPDVAEWGLTIYHGTNGYVYYSVWENGRSQPRTLHSRIMGRLAGFHVDHISGDKLDNRRSNLRFVSYSVNQVNRKSLNVNNRSGVRGVAFNALSRINPWRAQIMHNRQAIHLGLFATKAAAIAARREAELYYYGELCP